MNLIEILGIIIIHYIGDFVFQTHWQASNKNKRWDALLRHTINYSAIWILMLYFLPFLKVLSFIGITFVFHTITDYFTSRLNSKLWAKGDVHNFFVSVGFDQVLHYTQLFLTYYFLTNGR